jgi:hypothetical protein
MADTAKKGDIIVRRTINSWQRRNMIGNMHKVIYMDGDIAYYSGGWYLCHGDYRLATGSEIYKYNKGIRNTRDITFTKITNNIDCFSII